MEVRQYMTPEGLLELVLQNGALVCESLIREDLIHSPRGAKCSESSPLLEVRSSTLKLVRVCSAHHDAKS
jgi:hypothetical protein